MLLPVFVCVVMGAHIGVRTLTRCVRLNPWPDLNMTRKSQAAILIWARAVLVWFRRARFPFPGKGVYLPPTCGPPCRVGHPPEVECDGVPYLLPFVVCAVPWCWVTSVGRHGRTSRRVSPGGALMWGWDYLVAGVSQTRTPSRSTAL